LADIITNRSLATCAGISGKYRAHISLNFNPLATSDISVTSFSVVYAKFLAASSRSVGRRSWISSSGRPFLR
jgi:hypothetical protein